MAKSNKFVPIIVVYIANLSSINLITCSFLFLIFKNFSFEPLMLSMLAAIQGILALPVAEPNPSVNTIQTLGNSTLKQWCSNNTEKLDVFVGDNESYKNFVCEEPKNLLRKANNIEKYVIFSGIFGDWNMINKFKEVFSSEKDNIKSLFLEKKDSINEDSEIDFSEFFQLYFNVVCFEIFQKVQDKLDSYDEFILERFFNIKSVVIEDEFRRLDHVGYFIDFSDIADFVNRRLEVVVLGLASGKIKWVD